MPHPPRREGDKCPKGCACVLQEKRVFDLQDRAARQVFCAMCGARYEAADAYSEAIAAANRATDREIDRAIQACAPASA